MSLASAIVDMLLMILLVLSGLPTGADIGKVDTKGAVLEVPAVVVLPSYRVGACASVLWDVGVVLTDVAEVLLRGEVTVPVLLICKVLVADVTSELGRG